MWHQGPTGKAWIQAHTTVSAWLARLSKESTRSAYGHDLYLFCKATGKSPAELVVLRKSHKNGWNVTVMLQEFILHGKYEDERKGHKGEICEISQTSKNRRKALYTGIRSFFSLTHGDDGPLTLPEDPAFKIKEDDSREVTVGYITLEQANAIIGTMKEPYRTLFTIAKYAGMGNSELVYLNRLWPSLRKQLRVGTDPIRVDYGRRKSNNKPFFTLIPARLLRPYEQYTENPFQSKDEGKGRKAGLKPVRDYDLWIAWRAGRKRAGITEDVRPHHLRDLLITTGYALGLRKESTDFMVGHQVDPNGYLQIVNAPDTVVKEWRKIEKFLDSGLDPETSQELASQSQQISALQTELLEMRQNQQRVNEMLTRTLNFSPVSCDLCGSILGAGVEMDMGTYEFMCRNCGNKDQAKFSENPVGVKRLVSAYKAAPVRPVKASRKKRQKR